MTDPNASPEPAPSAPPEASAEPTATDTVVAPAPQKSAIAPVAVAALIVGIAAFLFGLIPVFGLLVALAGVTLGIVALVTKRGPKWMPLVGIAASSLALLTSLIIIASIGALSLARGGSEPAPLVSIPAEEQLGEEPDEEPVEQPSEEPAEPSLTMGQQQAVGSAESYLSFTSFSRQGLIDQLEYEGFTTADATFAVDFLSVDWNEQAALKAQEYIDFTNFSRQGLIDQLLYEGFSASEAEFGVTAVGY